MSSLSSPAAPSVTESVYRISPLIRYSLWLFYFALVIPLPILANVNHVGAVTQGSLYVGLGLGVVALAAALSEQVHLSATGMEIRYPQWVPAWFRQGWGLTWTEITVIKPRRTGQGGLVYYLVTDDGSAQLLPMRVAGFGQMTRTIEDQTGLKMATVKPLAQVWMYGILLGFSLLLALTDAWILWNGISHLGG
ncbi:hypothetical protein [Acaryochloris marina]|uniref:Uncharacterized protein n=1 Tax=Acaryochloris marina (strain MBIC 11017) TaxID=329726 RepID=B0C4G7_ACAM1|nr:hypothetical protein [Acaryochloris marina]ABW28711.1 conserved hypothetical protein [Acaryochloris marina MBIC11017]BDM77703.1 hypothetical protein AM10699_05770 [Acaryochloris marina MBIC10699]